MGFFQKLFSKFQKEQIDWDELEAILIASDIGVKLTMLLMEKLQAQGKKLDAAEVEAVCRAEIRALLPSHTDPLATESDPGNPSVVLVVGVNGTGKTTSTAKLAHFLQKSGQRVVLAAADTFRAAAIEQLERWGERLNIPVVKGQYKADPSSVCYAGFDAAVKNGADFLLCDTAGRLHTRNNLMEELKKIERVMAKRDSHAPGECLLVVDATTGSNALNQAREFHKAIPLTGVIVTKLDGSGKGGCVVAIQHELGIPTRFVGTGESADDLSPFDSESFVAEMV